MESNAPPRPIAAPAALGWRLLALTYDLLPMIPLLLIISAMMVWVRGGRTVEHAPAWAALQFGLFWLAIGLYFVVSWRRGGQTMGMRPWRLQVLAADGKPAAWRALWLRYLVASLTPGLCLLWTLVDRERRGLHDLAAGTLLVRRKS
jgi:uncharacterized RDD family membrane protein YckC